MNETEEIGGAPLITRDESAGVLEPGKEPFDLPAAFIAAERAAILREVDTVPPMGRNKLDIERGQVVIERVAIVRGVANDPRRIVW